MSSEIEIPCQWVSTLAFLADATSVIMPMSRQNFEVFMSRGFRVFLNAQEEHKERLVTNNMDYYEVLLRLTAGQDRQAMDEHLTEMLMFGENYANDGSYLKAANNTRDLRRLQELLRELQYTKFTLTSTEDRKTLKIKIE